MFDNIQVIDAAKFQDYTDNEKALFEAQRNSLLMIFPKWGGGTWDITTIKIAEDAAFVFVDTFPEEVKNPPPPAAATTSTTATTATP